MMAVDASALQMMKLAGDDEKWKRPKIFSVQMAMRFIIYAGEDASPGDVVLRLSSPQLRQVVTIS